MKANAILRTATWSIRAAWFVLQSLILLAALESPIRRRPLPEVCAHIGLSFTGFRTPAQEVRPLPRRVMEVSWAVDKSLLLWPWGRDRRCLRRGLVLGRLISDLAPALCLEVTALQPLEVHAVLTAHGQRLDLGPMALHPVLQDKGR